MNAITRFAFLLLLSVVAGRAESDVVVPVESVESFVNIRFAPDAKSEIVGQLHQGTNLALVETSDGWHEVALDGGGSGYVSADWSVVIGDEELIAENDEEVEADSPEAAEVIAAADVEEIAEGPVEIVAEEVVTEEIVAEEVIVEEVIVEEVIVEVPAGPIAPVAAATAAIVSDESAGDGAVELVVDASTDESAAPTVIASEVEDAIAPEPATAMANAPVNYEGSVDYLVKFIAPTEGGASQIFDDGRNVGIGTSEPQQRLEVNGNIQIHEQNSSVAGLMITQSSGDMGYIMHNRASTLTIGAGSIDRITITRDGNVGFGVNRPTHPVEMASGAHVTAGGVWTNSSSIEKKENVRDLTPEEALAALALLEPVKFNYKADDSEDYVGFIAEDVPDLVATSDRTGLSAMDIVAVLTSVVQQQQKKIEQLEARLDNP